MKRHRMACKRLAAPPLCPTPYLYSMALRSTAGPLKRDADTRHYPADYLREAVLLIVIIPLSNGLDTLAAVA